ncbi:toll/interleukin-1 receptor domain-containing protein [Hymenobacter sp. UYCo722]|uniref:toll/interleukin-1 receptor domain-containing protein n=1 Tax=Hymenobacter sp. UYCo722 TaxID=3156335 RepID=UPI00339B9CA6
MCIQFTLILCQFKSFTTVPSPIEINALRVAVVLFEKDRGDGPSFDGNTIQITTQLSARDINDAVDYLDSKGLIERLDYMGTSPYNFGNVGLNVHGRQFYYENKGEKMSPSKPRSQKASKRKGIRVFISHSSQNVEQAKQLIQLIRSALNLKVEEIRCTSVDGYRLPGGTSTDAQLQIEIYECELLIGLVSSDSMSSHYTLFELGARWGANSPMIPLLIDKKGPEILKGPLSGINALNAYEEAQLMQFVEDAGKVLKIKPEQPSSFHVHIKSLIASLPNATVKEKVEAVAEKKVIAERSDDYSNTDEIIRKRSAIEWPDDFDMQLHYVTTQRKAVAQLQKAKPEDIPENEFKVIRRKAAINWPNDFEMRAHEEDTQFKALRKLRGIEQAESQQQAEAGANISAELLHLEKTKLRLSVIPRFHFGRAMSNPQGKTITLMNNGNGRAKVESIEVVLGESDVTANITRLPLIVEKDREFNIMLSPKNQANMNLTSFRCQIVYSDELGNRYQIEIINSQDQLLVEEPILLP